MKKRREDKSDTFDHVDEILSLGKGSVLEVTEDFDAPAMSYLGTEVSQFFPAGTRIRLLKDMEGNLVFRGLAALEEVSLRISIPVEQWHLLKVTKRKEKRDEQAQESNLMLYGHASDDAGG